MNTRAITFIGCLILFSHEAISKGGGGNGQGPQSGTVTGNGVATVPATVKHPIVIEQYTENESTHFHINYELHVDVTDPQSQGGCDAGWAYSIAGMFEFVNKNKTGTLVELSAESLIELDTARDKCRGGDFRIEAVEHVILHGISLREKYQHEHVGDKTSKIFFDPIPKIYHIKDERSLVSAFFRYGPVSVIITINVENFKAFQGEIYDCSKPQEGAVNVPVLLVELNLPGLYWKIKHSYGIHVAGTGKGFTKLSIHGCGIGQSGYVAKN